MYSDLAIRNRKVHMAEDSATLAMVVTRPWIKAVRTARPMEPQRRPRAPAVLRGIIRAEVTSRA